MRCEAMTECSPNSSESADRAYPLEVQFSLTYPVILLDWRGVDLRPNPRHLKTLISYRDAIR